ncbi:T9SS type A sorting domain-containing protein [uncultured Microscilla sp.]|uniref:T9SS type A sorting domain-containing protein n=1 Tax=uncultured Microscilla sp. TaxID=432653 RepID=UPI002624C9F8|nr:T9SS type A sorting domain-containing protein [uncultured Microscilla sp.]
MNFRLITTFLFVMGFSWAQAQDIMMQGWYWDYPKTADGYKWTDTLRLKAAELSAAGINYLWIPPHVRASFGNRSNGYDPQDLYDLGEYGQGPTGLGTRLELDAMIAVLRRYGINPVGDMIYNHRDGGRPENNRAVAQYIKRYSNPNQNNPFPSDRYRCIIPLGGKSKNRAGTYYFKISSKTGAPRFHNKPYKLYMQTNKKGYGGLNGLNESENNCPGTGAADTIELGRDMFATLDAGGCQADEFVLTINQDDFHCDGDTLYIYMSNPNGDYTDHYIYEVWNTARNKDIEKNMRYQTYTDFTNLPSGRGGMRWRHFKPNGTPTDLRGDWDAMYFFYDYDQFVPATQRKLFRWTKWNWKKVGIRGLRMDAIKHFTPAFVGDLLDYLHDNGIDPGMVVGEWYGTNPDELKGWINNVLNSMDKDTKSAIQPKIFDFLLRDHLRQACDLPDYDVRQLYNENLQAKGLSGFNIVTFVNNHDFRSPIDAANTNFNMLIKNDPMLAYTFVLSNNQLGVPTIFYPDYYGYQPGKFNYHPTGVAPMKARINQLIKVHKSYIFGANKVEYLNRFGSPYTQVNYFSGTANKTMIYQLSGGKAGKEVIVAINFSDQPLRVDHQIKPMAQGTRFTDVLGRSAYPYAVVDGQNRIYVDLPARSYSVWVQGEVATIPLRATTNTTRHTTTNPGITGKQALDLNSVGMVKVFPNPFKNRFTLQLKSAAAGNTHLKVTDLHGKVVYAQKFSRKTKASFELGHLPAGSYLLKVHHNGQVYQEQLIKK